MDEMITEVIKLQDKYRRELYLAAGNNDYEKYVIAQAKHDAIDEVYNKLCDILERENNK